MYEYLHTVLEGDADINDWLNKRGQDGWRLHTFNQLQHSGTVISYYIVMDRFHPQRGEQDDGPGAMAMRG
jgi:hypothetical protein